MVLRQFLRNVISWKCDVWWTQGGGSSWGRGQNQADRKWCSAVRNISFIHLSRTRCPWRWTPNRAQHKAKTTSSCVFVILNVRKLYCPNTFLSNQNTRSKVNVAWGLLKEEVVTPTWPFIKKKKGDSRVHAKGWGCTMNHIALSFLLVNLSFSSCIRLYKLCQPPPADSDP